jgi:dUTP pyrophosphatase
MTDDALHLKVKKLKAGAAIPTRGSALAAGYDLYACLDEPVTIAPGAVVPVGTGLAMELPEGWFAAIFARSGLAVKQGLRPANCVGVCDADYRGEYIVPLYNDSPVPRTVDNGERIAQMVLLPCRPVSFELTEELGDTDRGGGGFGSTGK